MRIVCPQCGYSRDVPSDKVPSRSSMATCPKCQFRFRFRGHGQAPRGEDPREAPLTSPSDVVIEEPVYPPRPSRPRPSQPDPEPAYDYRPRPPFEPRTARPATPEPPRQFEEEPAPVPQEPHRPRPQARWLPDPEPGAEDDPAPRTRPRFPRFPRFPHAAEPESQAPSMPDEPWGRLGDDQTAPAEPWGRLGDDSPEPDEPRGYPGEDRPAPDTSFERSSAGLFDADEADEAGNRPERAAGGQTFQAVRPRTPYEPPEAPAAPWERPAPGSQREDSRDGLKESARSVPIERSGGFGEETPPGGRGQEDDAYSMPEPDGQPAIERSAAKTDAAEPQEESYWDQVQAPQAVAGDDSVRDIWARLQSMSGETRSALQGGEGKAKDKGKDEPGRSEEPAPAKPRTFTGETVVPWEQLEHYGAVPAFLNTIKNILFKPGDFFDQLPGSPGKLKPLVFAAVVCVLATLSWLVWNYFGIGPNFAELGRTDGFQGLGSGAIGGLAVLGLAPIILMAFSFLDAGLTQLLLILLRASTRSFEETFRALCYAGAPWMLAALPAPASYLIPVVLIWHMTLQAIGLKKLHQTGYPQILASVLLKWSIYFMGSFAVLHLVLTRR